MDNTKDLKLAVRLNDHVIQLEQLEKKCSFADNEIETLQNTNEDIKCLNNVLTSKLTALESKVSILKEEGLCDKMEIKHLKQENLDLKNYKSALSIRDRYSNSDKAALSSSDSENNNNCINKNANLNEKKNLFLQLQQTQKELNDKDSKLQQFFNELQDMHKVKTINANLKTEMMTVKEKLEHLTTIKSTEITNLEHQITDIIKANQRLQTEKVFLSQQLRLTHNNNKNNNASSSPISIRACSITSNASNFANLYSSYSDQIQCCDQSDWDDLVNDETIIFDRNNMGDQQCYIRSRTNSIVSATCFNNNNMNRNNSKHGPSLVSKQASGDNSGCNNNKALPLLLSTPNMMDDVARESVVGSSPDLAPDIASISAISDLERANDDDDDHESEEKCDRIIVTNGNDNDNDEDTGREGRFLDLTEISDDDESEYCQRHFISKKGDEHGTYYNIEPVQTQTNETNDTHINHEYGDDKCVNEMWGAIYNKFVDL